MIPLGYNVMFLILQIISKIKIIKKQYYTNLFLIKEHKKQILRESAFYFQYSLAVSAYD